MNLKTTGARLALICCLALLTAAWVAPAHAAGSEYACKCKGIEDSFLFFKTHGDCGNGFTGGNKGQVTKHIPKSDLTHYLPHTVIGTISGNNCGYYESSGWNCGKMKKATVPLCLND